jgi:hypothetical protein
VNSEPSDEGLDVDVERMLRTFEGPEHPVPRPYHRRARRPVILALAATVVVAAVGICAAFLLGDGRVREAALGTSQTCRTLELTGREYRAERASADAFDVGPTTGRGTLHCGRTQLRVTVARIAGVDPRAAVVRPGAAGRVYVAAGLCPGRRGGALLACLRNAPETP